jgi:hypothetical protein
MLLFVVVDKYFVSTSTMITNLVTRRETSYKFHTYAKANNSCHIAVFHCWGEINPDAKENESQE